ncbi:MAG: hypothetical protein U1A25_01890 [Candidatus Sungbacteria bacterium]|nr:hypothetical protein [Candidatus Sungbacteria bacterium]
MTLNSFFPEKYSYTHFSRKLLGLESFSKTNSQTVVSLLSRLKRQGLVERRGGKGASSWLLTGQGKKYLEKNRESVLPVPQEDGITRLVIFDVPERERRKRDSIRAELIGFNFRQLQKSVWIGYNPLPVGFIELIDELNLKNSVHIFSVREAGTLEE